eukprot:scaffold28111_cov60-Attheya_sp.AAC.3
MVFYEQQQKITPYTKRGTITKHVFSYQAASLNTQQFDETVYNEQGATRQPLRIFRQQRFIQLPATVFNNTFRDSLIGSNGIASKESLMTRSYFSNLLGGNGGGAISIPFDNADHVVEVHWSGLFFYSKTIHIWGEAPFLYDFKQIIKDRTSLITRYALYQQLLTEVDGDQALTMDLSRVYSEMASKVVDASSKPVMVPKPLLALVGDKLMLLHAAAQTKVMEQIEGTYGRFMSLTDPILLQSDLDSLSGQALSILPAQYEAISEMLGYDKSPKTKTDYLNGFRQRMVFYVILILSRIRCNKNFSNWSLLQSAVAYGSSAKTSSRRLPIVFGMSSQNMPKCTNKCISSIVTLLRLCTPAEM